MIVPVVSTGAGARPPVAWGTDALRGLTGADDEVALVVNSFDYNDGRTHFLPLFVSTKVDAERAFIEGPDILESGPSNEGLSTLQRAVARVGEVSTNSLRMFPSPDDAGGMPPASPGGAWVLDKGVPDNKVLFRCPRPHEHYAGWVRRFDARIDPANDGASAERSVLTVSVDSTSVTLGDSGIDETVAYSIEAEEHPVCKAVLTFDWASYISSGADRPSARVLKGEFEMAGRRIPVGCVGKSVWAVSPDGMPRLQLEGTFLVPLSQPFRITGVVGTPPANDVVLFFVRVTLKEAAKTSVGGSP